jgi:hypothetical protein
MELPVCEYRREGTYSPLPSAYLPRVGWTPGVENGLSERGVDPSHRRDGEHKGEAGSRGGPLPVCADEHMSPLRNNTVTVWQENCNKLEIIFKLEIRHLRSLTNGRSVESGPVSGRLGWRELGGATGYHGGRLAGF